MQYRKKSSLVEAVQWLKHGDHSQVQNLPSEGTDIPGSPYCPVCGNFMHRHGLLDGVNGEEIVCPGDYIVNDREGLPYRSTKGEFEAHHERYVRPPSHEQMPISDLEERRQNRGRNRS